MAGTLRIDNTNGTNGDTQAQRATASVAPPPVWNVIDPSSIPVGSFRDYTVPAGTYMAAVTFGTGPVSQFTGNVVVDGATTTIALP